MENNQPKVSVIIPTYNRGYIIEKAIMSVLNQTFPVHEVIIVDDGSTDNTVDIINGMNDSRIKLTKNKRSKGANGARNTGILEANGNYIAFQDSDDFWHDNKIQAQIEVFVNNPEIDFCFTSFNSGTYRNVIPKSKVDSNKIHDKLFNGNFIGTPTMCMKIEVAKKIDFSEELKRFQDWDFVLRVSQQFNCFHLEQVLVTASLQENSISKSNGLITLQSLNYLVDTHGEFKNKSVLSKLIYNRVKTKKAIDERNLFQAIRYGLRYIYQKSLSILLKKESD